MLISPIFVNNVFADWTQSIWNLERNDEFGYQISCPNNWYEVESILGQFQCSKSSYGTGGSIVTNSVFVSMFTDPDLFNEREASLFALNNISVIFLEGKVTEKKISKWFDTITVDIEFAYKNKDGKALGKYIIKNSGRVYSAVYLANVNDYDKNTGKKALDSLKILNLQEIQKLESEKNAREKKQVEESIKNELQRIKEQRAEEQKIKEIKKKIEDKKKAEEKKIKASDDKLKSEARKSIKQWKEKAKQLDYRVAAITGASEHTKFNIDSLYAGFVGAVNKYEAAINSLKNTTQDKVNKVVKENESRIKQKYGDIVAFLDTVEHTEEMKNRYPTSEDQYEKVYGKKPTIPSENQRADTDGDYTPDSIDKCPIKPEDFDGYLDNDGCPE